MADDVQIYDVSCPANTLASAPVERATVPASTFTVTRVWIIIPDGHAGLTGIALAYGHAPVVPSNPGAWISGNDEYFPFELSGMPLGVPWSVLLCNNDTQSHVWQTRWELSAPAPAPSALTPTPLTARSILTAAGSAGGA